MRAQHIILDIIFYQACNLDFTKKRKSKSLPNFVLCFSIVNGSEKRGNQLIPGKAACLLTLALKHAPVPKRPSLRHLWSHPNKLFSRVQKNPKTKFKMAQLSLAGRPYCSGADFTKTLHNCVSGLAPRFMVQLVQQMCDVL